MGKVSEGDKEYWVMYKKLKKKKNFHRDITK